MSDPPPNTDVFASTILDRISRMQDSVERAAGSLQERERRLSPDEARSWISQRIIVMFIGVVGAVLFILVLQGWMTGDWSRVGPEAVDLLKSAVLPVVTLVLGYYFGQSSKTN